MLSVLFGLVAALGWGAADFIARFSGRAIGHMNALLGMLATGVIILTLIILTLQPAFDWTMADLQSHGWLLLFNGVAVTAATLMVYKAVVRGPVSLAAPIIGSYPAWVVLFYSFTTDATLNIMQWCSVILVMAGVAMVAVSDPEGEITDTQTETPAKSDHKPTVITAFLASAGLSVSIISGQAAANSFGELQTTWITRIISLISLLGLFAILKETIRLPKKWWPALSGQGVGDSSAYLATFAGAMTMFPQITAVIGSTFGAVTVLLARIFLKERLKPAQWAGVAAIFIAVATLSY